MRNPLHIFRILLFSTLLFLLCGCGATEESRRRMDRAESLMETAPDSALTILDSVSPRSLLSGRDRARHALLKSMALDKNYIDTITFDVLQPAIDYYLEKGSPDERLRTLYYQGRIFQNRREDEEAMRCFIKATELKEEASDSLTLARLCTARSVLYYDQNRFESYVKCALAGADIYRDLDRKSLFADNLLRSLDGYILMKKKTQADSLFSVLASIPDSIVESQSDYIHCKVSYAMTFLSKPEIRSVLDSVNIGRISENYALLMALGYAKAGDGELAREFLEALPKDYDGDRLQYLSIKSEVLESCQEKDSALRILREAIGVSDSIEQQWTSDDRFFVEKKYELEREIGQQKVSRRNTAIGLLSVCLVLLIVSFCLYMNRREGKIRELSLEKEQLRLELDGKKLEERILTLSAQYDKIKKEYDKGDKERIGLELEKNRLNDKIDVISDQCETMQKEYDNLEKEYDKLKKETAQDRMRLSDIAEHRRQAIEELHLLLRERVQIINGMLASHIGSNKKYRNSFDKLIEKADREKEDFFSYLKNIFNVIYPTFMEMLRNKGLTEQEMFYACLYAMGLSGKEIGGYFNTKSHYNISSEIRQKLGLDSKGTNLSIYLRNLMEQGNSYLSE